MGQITERQFARAISEQRRRKMIGKVCMFGKLVVEMGFCTEDEVESALAEQRRHRVTSLPKTHTDALQRVYAAFDRTLGATKEMRKETRGVVTLKFSPQEE